MDDSDLINEVLEATLAYQRADATAEERARLERLLSDNPQAIAWYLRVVDDTLTLRASASAQENQPPAAASEADADELCTLAVADRRSPGQTARANFPAARRTLRRWGTPVAAACLLAAIAVALSWWPREAAPVFARNHAAGGSARVVNVSNVEWSLGAKHYDEWSFLQPGESLKFERGLVNLFLDNGAELLVEGPADVDFVSVKKVFARKGKLAARVSPTAIGFSIETPHANVIDRGTSFGMSVAEGKRTDVVVYEGMVDLDVVGDNPHSRQRLERGEAMSVNRLGKLSRITTVQSSEFLEPPQVRVAGNVADRVITAVSDNARSMETAKYYRVIPGGFREDCRAYVDRLFEWNGVDERGLPPFLMGGDYVMTFNDDKILTEIEIAVSLGQPASLYVIVDDRAPRPKWLTRDFVDTNWDIGSDEGYDDHVIDNGVGPGESIEHVCSVWRRDVSVPSTVVLGGLTDEKPEKPPVPTTRIGRSMYGIVATPLRRDQVQPDWAMRDETRKQ
jgi:ferric-dicitrate binding protein FerR (iron transport regulator)